MEMIYDDEEIIYIRILDPLDDDAVIKRYKIVIDSRCNPYLERVREE